MAVRTLATALALIGLLQLIDLLERTSGLLARGGGLDVLRWMVLRMPFLFHEVAPFAVLGGALFTFSQLARSSELVVMRISGLSVVEIFKRTLPVALAVAALDLVVTDQITPRAEQFLRFVVELHHAGGGGEAGRAALVPHRRQRGGGSLRRSQRPEAAGRLGV